MALGTALALQLGTTALGAGAQYLNRPPDIPDLSAEAAAEFSERRRDLDAILDTRRREVEADLAASGRTGSAGATSRQRIFGEFAGGQADVASRGAKAVSGAEQREQMARFRRGTRRSQNRAQAISDLVGGVGGTLALNQLEGEGTNDVDPTEPPSGEDVGQRGLMAGGGFDVRDFMREDLETRFGISPGDSLVG